MALPEASFGRALQLRVQFPVRGGRRGCDHQRLQGCHLCLQHVNLGTQARGTLSTCRAPVCCTPSNTEATGNQLQAQPLPILPVPPSSRILNSSCLGIYPFNQHTLSQALFRTSNSKEISLSSRWSHLSSLVVQPCQEIATPQVPALSIHPRTVTIKQLIISLWIHFPNGSWISRRLQGCLRGLFPLTQVSAGKGPQHLRAIKLHFALLSQQAALWPGWAGRPPHHPQK